MEPLEEIVYETLSFYQDLTLEELILQMDKKKIESLPELTVDQLKEVLKKLRSIGVIREKKVIKGKYRVKAWRRVFRRAWPWWKRIFYRLLGDFKC